MKEKIQDWLGNKYSALKKVLSYETASNTPETDNEAKDARRKFSDALDSFSGFFGNLAKNFEENTHLQQFITLGEWFRKSGYYAGQWGVREDDISGSAAMQVRITKNLIEEKGQSTQRRLNSQVAILETIKKNAERDYRTKNSYYEKINRAYQYNHKHFSWLLGIIYGAVALVLVAADIPLALELTKKGFNLKADLENPISDLFAFNVDEGFLSFLLHIFKVLTVNWEVVLFATGVAFCTIYIKIFYDEYIGSPLENLIKRASEAPIAEYEELHSTEAEDGINKSPVTSESLDIKKKVNDRFNRLWWWRFSARSFVLAILFLTIVVLGYFRSSVAASDPDLAGTSTRVVSATYTLLTLIFPIISGICASLSLNNLHNWAERRRAEKQNLEARKVVLEATDEYRVKEEEKERNSGFIKWLSSQDTIDQLTNYMIRCYESGYKFGYLYPEWTFGGDLFTRAEAMRNRNLPDPSVGPVTPVELIYTAVN